MAKKFDKYYWDNMEEESKEKLKEFIKKEELKTNLEISATGIIALLALYKTGKLIYDSEMHPILKLVLSLGVGGALAYTACDLMDSSKDALDDKIHDYVDHHLLVETPLDI